MEQQPFFTICIPCFNHGQYIGATIQSVLDQDFEDFEIMVADNASTDNSRHVIKSFKDSRIRLIENRFNIGYAGNLQQVTRHARGRFLNLLSSDDIINQGALRSYSKLISRYEEKSHRLVLMSQAWEIDGDGNVFGYIAKRSGSFAPKRIKVPRKEEIEAQEDYEIHSGFNVFRSCLAEFNTAGIFCSIVYSRQLWEEVEGYNSTQLMNPDMHFIIKILRLLPTVIYINRPLYSYRSHMMGQARQQAKTKVLKFQVDEYNLLMQYDDDWLSGTGVTREHQRKIFVNRDCLDHAMVALAEGKWTMASRLLAFAGSTYPGVVIRQWKSWALGLLLAGGPIGAVLVFVVRSLYKMGRKGLPSLAD